MDKELDLSDYKHNDDLASAETLPSRWYTDADFLYWEKRRIFWKTWQLVGSKQLLQRPGDYFACDVLGEPIVISRGLQNELRAFYNVCRHRAGRIACGKGNRKTFQCQYHGWTYNLAGELLKAPEFEDVKNWDCKNFGLLPIQAVEWGPFIFVNLDPQAPPLMGMLGNIPAEILREGFSIDNMIPVERRDYYVNCNWKVYIDNYLEGYHIPVAHPGLYKELDYKQYRVDTFAYYSSQHAPFRPLKPGDIPGVDRRYLRTEAEKRALYYWLFPNTMLNFYPDNLQINTIIPIDENRTLTVFEWYFSQPGSGEGWESMQQAIAFSEQVQKEDIELCESVQKGLESQSYKKGRFSVKRENGVHHFQSLVYKFLNSQTLQ